jgi:hypothetical protein
MNLPSSSQRVFFFLFSVPKKSPALNWAKADCDVTPQLGVQVECEFSCVQSIQLVLEKAKLLQLK